MTPGAAADADDADADDASRIPRGVKCAPSEDWLAKVLDWWSVKCRGRQLVLVERVKTGAWRGEDDGAKTKMDVVEDDRTTVATFPGLEDKLDEHGWKGCGRDDAPLFCVSSWCHEYQAWVSFWERSDGVPAVPA
jgi:hypothetical protein